MGKKKAQIKTALWNTTHKKVVGGNLLYMLGGTYILVFYDIIIY
jgi:hypothetical protein